MEAHARTAGTPTDAMTDTLAHPESLTRYTYVVDSPATKVDPCV
jgi:hypothetical protein